jgi:hypothetical protein
MVTWVRSAGSLLHFVFLSQDGIFIARPMEATVVEAVGSGVVRRCRSTVAPAPYTASPKKEKDGRRRVRRPRCLPATS